MGMDINCYKFEKKEPEKDFQNNNNNNNLKKSFNNDSEPKNFEKETDIIKSQNNNKDVDKMKVKESKGSYVVA